MSVALAPGEHIANRYLLRRLIGEGGMGVVWAAEHLETHEVRALKFIKGEQVTETTRRRFLREARAASAIKHPAIVEVREILELDDGRPVLVMEYLEGESLASRLDRGRMIPLRELAAIIQPVVSALGAAHAIGIVHRDLKPENIFLAHDPNGQLAVKVLDFGIAKLTAIEGQAAQSSGALTGTGSILGTPYYMAPEQIFGEKDVDHRADVWSLGIILYEALSGLLPTEAENVGQVLKIVVTMGIAPLERVAAALPEDVTSLVNRMLSRRREDRPADLREVRRVLTRYTDATTTSFGEPSVSVADLDRDSDDGGAARAQRRTMPEARPSAPTVPAGELSELERSAPRDDLAAPSAPRSAVDPLGRTASAAIELREPGPSRARPARAVPVLVLMVALGVASIWLASRPEPELAGGHASGTGDPSGAAATADTVPASATSAARTAAPAAPSDPPDAAGGAALPRPVSVKDPAWAPSHARTATATLDLAPTASVAPAPPIELPPQQW